MKQSEFINVKNGILVDYETWPKLFGKLLDALRDYAAKSEPVPGKFRLSAVESHEEFNAESLCDEFGLYVRTFRFVCIYEGTGMMERSDFALPPQFLLENRARNAFNTFSWINDYWMNRELPISCLLDRTDRPERTEKGLAREVFKQCDLRDFYDADSAISHYFGPADKSTPIAVLIHRESQRFIYLKAQDRYGDPEKPAVTFTVDDKSQEMHRLCPGVRYRYRNMVPTEIIETNAVFDALPLGEKARLLTYAIDRLCRLWNAADKYC